MNLILRKRVLNGYTLKNELDACICLDEHGDCSGEECEHSPTEDDYPHERCDCNNTRLEGALSLLEAILTDDTEKIETVLTNIQHQKVEHRTVEK